jgi:surfeit locus 1 family protein
MARSRQPRGVPLVPTLITVLAVIAMVGLGFWQLQRLRWKEAMLARMAAETSAPMRDIGAAPVGPEDEFRLLRLSAHCPPHPAVERGGRNHAGEPGFSLWLLCRAGGAPLWVDIGWQARPGGEEAMLAARTLATGAPVTLVGVAVRSQTAEASYRLVLRDGVAPLVPSAPPDRAEIPNNHLAYAIQWFAFAAVLIVIYGVWLHRHRRQDGTRGH